MEDLSSDGEVVPRLAVVYVVRGKVSGWRVRVVVGNLAVCCVEWPGFGWRVRLWG